MMEAGAFDPASPIAHGPEVFRAVSSRFKEPIATRAGSAIGRGGAEGATRQLTGPIEACSFPMIKFFSFFLKN